MQVSEENGSKTSSTKGNPAIATIHKVWVWKATK